jgi:hypothetical protein
MARCLVSLTTTCDEVVTAAADHELIAARTLDLFEVITLSWIVHRRALPVCFGRSVMMDSDRQSAPQRSKQANLQRAARASRRAAVEQRRCLYTA